MLTLSAIRKDLKEIRYYYSRQKIFDEATKEVGGNSILEKVYRYNDAIKIAPPRFYDMYVCLYVRNYTQEALSAELGYTPEYIQRQHKKLLQFLQLTIK